MISFVGQRWLNRCIDGSAAARELAMRLEGKRLAVHVAGTGQRIDLVARDGGLALEHAGGEPADAELVGAPLDLLRLAAAGRDALGRLRETRARLGGDTQVAEQFAEVLRLAKPDPEEALAAWVGDIAAHEAGSIGRALVRFCRNGAAAVALDVGEYLQEEQPVLAARPRLRGFVEDVDRLRDDVERLEQRIAGLERARPGRG
jgi:ubiquinone biosynthesis protein UbiJ